MVDLNLLNRLNKGLAWDFVTDKQNFVGTYITTYQQFL